MAISHHLQGVPMKSELGMLALAIMLSACASTAPTTESSGLPNVGPPDLACLLPSNCVSSKSTSDFLPLPYTGTAAQALDQLRATLATFPEATIVRDEARGLEVIFTTPVGFKDQVDFSIDPTVQRIDFRSRSLFGLYDFGKNRSRMQEFVSRFEKQSRR